MDKSTLIKEQVAKFLPSLLEALKNKGLIIESTEIIEIVSRGVGLTVTVQRHPNDFPTYANGATVAIDDIGEINILLQLLYHKLVSPLTPQETEIVLMLAKNGVNHIFLNEVPGVGLADAFQKLFDSGLGINEILDLIKRAQFDIEAQQELAKIIGDD